MLHDIAKLFRTNKDLFKDKILNNDIDLECLVKEIYNYDLYNGTQGYLYCMFNPVYASYGNDVYKLGMAKDVSKRIAGYTTSYIEPSTILIQSNPLKNYSYCETILFDILKQYRVKNNREFFKCNSALIQNAIDKIHNMYLNNEVIYSDSIIKAIYIEVKAFINDDPIITRKYFGIIKKNYAAEIFFGDIVQIVDAPLVDLSQYSILVDKQNKDKDDLYKIQKYKLFNWYSFKNNINNDDAIAFFNNVQGNRLKKQIDFWAKSILLVDDFIDGDTVYDFFSDEKHELLDRLLKDIGFNNGVLSNNVIREIRDFDVSKQDLNKMRVLFRTDGDIGNFRAKKEPQKFILRINDLLNHFYGIKIKFDSYNEYCKKTKKSERVNRNFCIQFSDPVKDYLVLKYPLKIDILPFNKKDKFKFTHIHGVDSTYEDYISNIVN